MDDHRTQPLKRRAVATDHAGVVSFVRRLLRAEDGIALPVAMSAMVLVLALGAGAAATAMRANSAVIKDRAAKQAQGAAETGLQLGYLRLAQASGVLEPTDCVTLGKTPPINGECPARVESLGNRVRTSYVVATPTTGACPVLPGRAPAPGDRCITATGEADGVKRRLQARVNLTLGFKPWASMGVLAKKMIDVDMNGVWNTSIGANEEIRLGKTTINGSATSGGPINQYHHEGRINGARVTNAPKFELPNVEFEPYEAVNDNENLRASGFYSDPNGANANTVRAFRIPMNTSYTIPAGVYSFCSFRMENGARLRIPVNAVVKIFIDSPSRSGTSCQSGGTISAGNDVQLNREFGPDAAARATQLDVFVHGRAVDSMADPDVNFDSNNLMFYGTLYAPNSFVNVWNNGEIVGGFVGENIDFKNGAGFVYPSSIVNKELPGFKGTVRKGWFECTPTPVNPNDPESGCLP